MTRDNQSAEILAGICCPDCGGDVKDIGAEIARCVVCGYSFDTDQFYSEQEESDG